MDGLKNLIVIDDKFTFDNHIYRTLKKS